MRWVVLLLLIMGALFTISAFTPAPAGQPELMRPFTVDTQPAVGFVGGLPGQPGGTLTALFAGVAALCFLASIVGLFWKAIPINWWPPLVIVAVAASLLLYLFYFGVWMIAPIVVDAILLWGVLTKRWTAETLPIRTMPSDAPSIHPLMTIPVPWTFILAFLIGLALQYLIPLTISSPQVILISHIVGTVLTVVGTLFAIWSLGIFRSAHTTTVPFETPSQFITSGPYRFSRNPMYLSLTLVYLGVAGLQAQIWPLITLPFLLFYIQRIVIPVEEARLQETFGDAYQQYCAQVRRDLVSSNCFLRFP